jgi:hypothetical protein
MIWTEALARHIATNVPSFTVGQSLFIGVMPEDETDGPTGGLAIEPGTVITLGGNAIIDQPVLLFGVRAKSYQAAYDSITTVRELLRAINGQTINGTYFIGVKATSPVEDLDRDARGRQQYLARFEVTF